MRQICQIFALLKLNTSKSTMKLLISTLVTCIVLSVSAIAGVPTNRNISTTASLEVKVSSVAEKEALTVHVRNNFSKTITVQIKSIEGELIYVDKVADVQHFERSYVLDKLRAGTYILEVVNEDNFFSKRLTIK